ncbi:MAG: RNA polymerase sigma factor [Mangrovibacterium sp.]
MEASANKSVSVEDLWKKFQEGRYVVMEELFIVLFRDLYTYGMKLLPVREIVRDTIQDVFADIWTRREKMYTVEKVRPYLFMSVRHELLKQIERQKRTSSLKQTPVSSFEFSMEDFIVREETQKTTSQLIMKCLQRLTARQREVILLRFHHELKFDEIARVMNMNVQSVRNLLVRALESIRQDKKFLDLTGSNVGFILFQLFQSFGLSADGHGANKAKLTK